MGTEGPITVVIASQCAPTKATCAKCGKPGRQKRTLIRTGRRMAYKVIAFLIITYREYSAGCECCTTLRDTGEDPGTEAEKDGTALARRILSQYHSPDRRRVQVGS